MPRIRTEDESLDLCCDCWNDLSETDYVNLAKLAYVTVFEMRRLVIEEGDGGAHPSYDTYETNCILCDMILTSDDDIGEPVTPQEGDEE